ncbi:MAG: 4Fe-4S dicluster domain-containing protein [Nanoarchaeota archaeon]|nr:4Fe-4S dicluster domain-containing protein [Nanoarchaeota archaeon]
MLNVTKEGYLLPKKDLNKLIKILKNYGEVIGPVQDKKWLRMKEIKDAKEISLTGISWFTSKKYFFPEKQTMFTFNGTKLKKFSDFPKRVLFGLRLCDLNAFHVNDKLFLEQEPKNHNYANFRKNITLIGLWCDKPQDKYCFCDSMELQHYYDLCLFEKKDKFHIKVGSEKGEKILKELKLKIKDEHWKEFPKCEMQLKTKDIKKFFERDDIWKKGVDDCLSCGDCTTLCPTCLCFDVEDEVNLDLKSGTRFAKWDSCMYKDFTLVAGGHVFRNTRINRFKHRIYHKLDYFPSKYQEYMCTGCGRCIRGCPTKIDWVSLINEMEMEESN